MLGTEYGPDCPSRSIPLEPGSNPWKLVVHSDLGLLWPARVKDINRSNWNLYSVLGQRQWKISNSWYNFFLEDQAISSSLHRFYCIDSLPAAGDVCCSAIECLVEELVDNPALLCPFTSERRSTSLLLDVYCSPASHSLPVRYISIRCSSFLLILL